MDWSKRFKEKMRKLQNENTIVIPKLNYETPNRIPRLGGALMFSVCPVGLQFGRDISNCGVNCFLYDFCNIEYKRLESLGEL